MIIPGRTKGFTVSGPVVAVVVGPSIGPGTNNAGRATKLVARIK